MSRSYDPFEQSKLRKKRMMVVSGFVVGAMMVAQIVSFYFELKSGSEERRQLKLALQNDGQGDHDTALEILKNIKTVDFSETGLTPQEQARAHALRAELSLKNGDLSGAETEFAASLEKDETFLTLHNLAITKLKLKKAKEAEALLTKALKIAEADSKLEIAATVIAAFEVALALDRSETDPKMSRLLALRPTLENAAKREGPYQERVRLIQAIASFHTGDAETFKTVAFELMDTSERDSETSAPTGLDESLVEWKHLYPYCTELYNQRKATDLVAAFYAACLRRSHDAGQALPYAKYALGLKPDNAIYAGLTADLMLDLKKTDEAKKLLLPDGKPLNGSRLATRAINLLGLREPAAATDDTENIESEAESRHDEPSPADESTPRDGEPAE